MVGGISEEMVLTHSCAEFGKPVLHVSGYALTCTDGDGSLMRSDVRGDWSHRLLSGTLDNFGTRLPV